MMVWGNSIANRKLILRFSPQLVDEPIVYHLVKDFGLIPNIINAQISPEKEGFLLMAIYGYETDYRRALDYLRDHGLEVQPLVEHVSWDEALCSQCGLCSGVCPSGAFYLERPGQRVHFNADKCMVCNICVQACPMHAIKLDV